MKYIIDLLIALVFLVMNAAFVLAEYAIIKVRYTKLEELSAKGNKRADLAKHAVKHLDGYLSSIQLGITMASLGLGWIGEPALAHLLAPVFTALNLPFSTTAAYSISFGAAFIVMTGAHVILGELVPKYAAILMTEKMALAVALPLNIFYRLTHYPVLIINKSANFVTRAIGIHASESDLLHSDEELRMILGQSQEYGKISLGRLMMFEHLFDFGKTSVKEIMTPKSAIAWLSVRKTWAENLKIIREKKFSRYPLSDAPQELESGFVHLKDLSIACFEEGGGAQGPELIKFRRELRRIPEEITVEKALREFQEQRIQLALTKNSAGETTGLLTMEDIVEELTGEIRDEFDQPPRLLLNDALIKEACALDLKETSRFEAIGEVLAKLHAAAPCFDKDEALKAIIKRETNFSTALGHQTAFPHARLASLSKPLLAVGKSRDGIYFPSPDNQPVKVIFLILTPFNEPTLQLNILSQLSGLISNLTLRKRLFAAKTTDQLLDIVLAFENKVMK
ncbi:MAG: CNNM domain-containing protein [Elusimicrobia bacterium]|nr:CNNM domain-containing protein [Elusimicrobiota bacterium]